MAFACARTSRPSKAEVHFFYFDPFFFELGRAHLLYALPCARACGLFLSPLAHVGPLDDGRLWGVAKRFNDHGDGSIDEINLLLGSPWR
jgi:hypothetical protein